MLVFNANYVSLLANTRDIEYIPRHMWQVEAGLKLKVLSCTYTDS